RRRRPDPPGEHRRDRAHRPRGRPDAAQVDVLHPQAADRLRHPPAVSRAPLCVRARTVVGAAIGLAVTRASRAASARRSAASITAWWSMTPTGRPGATLAAMAWARSRGVA